MTPINTEWTLVDTDGATWTLEPGRLIKVEQNPSLENYVFIDFLYTSEYGTKRNIRALVQKTDLEAHADY